MFKMKKAVTTGNTVCKIVTVFFLTIVLLITGKASFAHKVERYTVSCFLQGETVVINASLSSTGYNSYIHWQYRTSPGAAWVYLSNGNNIINGRSFFISGASQPTYIPDSTENLVIANVGSPAYTSQLDNIEFRLLMTDFGLDPETHPWPAIPVYGAEEYGDKDAKYIRIRARPAGENCYSACTNNILVINPAAVPPPITDYFGGFEVPGSGNFSTPGTNGVTTKAYTDITQWTSGTPGNNPRYRIMNNPDSMNTSFPAFAPHSGMNMMVVNANNSCTNRAWYRTVAVSNANQFYQGTVIFRAWVAKVSGAANPAVMLEIKGGTTVTSSTASYISLGNTTQTISAAPGTWVQLSVSINIQANLYQKLEVSIKTPNACGGTPVYIALDDLCLIEPVSGLLPVIMTPLKAVYSNAVSHLQWSSLQEQNSSYFEVQRSNDGINYNHLANVMAKGSSDTEVKYGYNDIKAEAGVNYYRLKLVDKDGHYQYSNIAAVTATIKGINITGVYPAPFTNKVNITVSSDASGNATVSLFDNTGKLLVQQQHIITKGVNNLAVEDLGKLANGIYVMKIQAGDMLMVKKLIK